MSSFNPEWPISVLVDCTKNSQVPYGIVQPGNHDEMGVPIIRVNNFQNGRIDTTDLMKVAPEISEKHKKTILKGGEILLTIVGTTGLTAIVPKTFAGFNVARAVAVIDPLEGIGPTWIQIILQSENSKNFLNVRANTTVQKTLNLKDVRELPIPIPPLDTRIKIEKVYSSINLKVDNNLSLNSLLENISMAFFKSWFIDFDPVYAKKIAYEAGFSSEKVDRAAMAILSGVCSPIEFTANFKEMDELLSQKLSKMSDDEHEELRSLASLFPIEFEESELGDIPKGFEVESISNALDLAYGKSLKKENRVDGSFNVYGSGGITGSHNEYLVEGPGIIVGRKGTVGSLYWEDDNFFPIDTVFYVKPTDNYSLFYLFRLLQTLGLSGMNTDTSVPGLNRDNVYRLKFSNPSSELKEKFSNIDKSFRALIRNNQLEVQSLIKVRDTLLPKLLAGELDLSNIAIEDAH